MPSKSVRLASVLAFWVISATQAAWAWPPDGVVLSQTYAALGHLVVSDGSGGAIVAWTYPGLRYDVYAQRVTASGEIAPGWPLTGVPVCAEPASQFVTSAAPDGHGGVVIAWEDFRNGGSPAGSRVDIYAQRLLADGSIAPGWAVNGVPVARPPGDQRVPVVAADGLGGAFFSWHDEATEDIYLQHLTGSGEVAPGWPANGLAVCTVQGVQGYPQAIPDGEGGALVAWGDLRDGRLAAYAQRVQSSATIAPGWPENGAKIVLDRAIRGLIPDGAGGGYMSCATLGAGLDSALYLQRFTADGTIAPGWPEGGAPVCLAPGDRSELEMVPDGTGGVLLAWSDKRVYPDEIYLQRVRPDGALHPGWPLDGLRVTDDTAFDGTVSLAADGFGGAYLGWDRYAAPLGESQSFVQHVSGTAVPDPGWPPGGQAVPGQPRTGVPELIEDGEGGMIVVWEDANQRLRALRYSPDGPVPVLLSLVSAEAEPGLVRLAWQAPGGGALRATVERRGEVSDWEPIASVLADGTGTLRHEDRAVTPGARYAYRLAYLDEGVEQRTAETWVTVPRLELTLRGFTPNPSTGMPRVSFVLGGPSPARLEVYDVAGRKVAGREVGSLGPGRHEVALDGGAPLAAGVYAIRLAQDGQVVTARGVVTR